MTAAALLVAGGAASPASVSPVCADAHIVPNSRNLARVRAATLCLINAKRSAHGLRPLRENAPLQAAAEAHTAQMVARDYFDHVGPAGESPLRRALRAGYATASEIRWFGENIAAASGSLATPAATVASWMASPPHRAQILNPAFRDTGIGVVAGLPRTLGMGRSGATYAEDFGTRA